jgi:hypothetical protein
VALSFKLVFFGFPGFIPGVSINLWQGEENVKPSLGQIGPGSDF